MLDKAGFILESLKMFFLLSDCEESMATFVKSGLILMFHIAFKNPGNCFFFLQLLYTFPYTQY